MRSCPVCGGVSRQQLAPGFFRCLGRRRTWSDGPGTPEPVGYRDCHECYLDTGGGGQRAWAARWFGWYFGR